MRTKKSNQNILEIESVDFDVFSANFIKKKLELFSNKKAVNIALSGGSTPLPILNILKDYNLNWDTFNFFLVDERVVNVNSNQSNYKNINEIFFEFISSKSYPFLKENLSIDEMVLQYEKQIISNVNFTKSNQPKFDIVILGMGEDGHTASLFPNSIALKESKAFFVKNYVLALDSYRGTLTYPALASSKELIVLIRGENKLKIFEKVINGNGEEFPISKLLYSKINWLIAK